MSEPPLLAGIHVGAATASIGYFADRTDFSDDEIRAQQFSNGRRVRPTVARVDGSGRFAFTNAGLRAALMDSTASYLSSPAPYLGLGDSIRTGSGYGSREVDPVAVLGALIVRLRDTLDDALGGRSPLASAVAATPLGASRSWHESLARAFSLAGLDLAGTIPEPAAAIASYLFSSGYHRERRGSEGGEAGPLTLGPGMTVLVCDWGADLVQLNAFRVLDLDGPGIVLEHVTGQTLHGAGGHAVDGALARRALGKAGVSRRLRSHSLAGFAGEIETAKAIVASGEIAVIEIGREGTPAIISLTPEDLAESLGHGGETSIGARLSAALATINEASGPIDLAIATGGSSRIRLLARLLGEFAGEVSCPADEEHADLAAVRGAVVAAASAAGRDVVPVTLRGGVSVPAEIGLLWPEGSGREPFEPLAPAGTSILARPPTTVIPLTDTSALIHCAARTVDLPYRRSTPRLRSLAKLRLDRLDPSVPLTVSLGWTNAGPHLNVAGSSAGKRFAAGPVPLAPWTG